MLTIDGAYGEGGGQIIRTSLALATILTRSFRIKNIRAGRKNPGLAAQHLTAIRAAAKISDAVVSGAELGSQQLTFEPNSPPIPGVYEFDVAEAREGGSAGAATLVLQTVLLPLALARAASQVILKGGTHVAWSPPYHYVQDVYLPMLALLGVEAEVKLLAWGWYPAGEGQIELNITGQTDFQGNDGDLVASSLRAWNKPGSLRDVRGVAVAANLPAHIAQRICNRAINLLEKAGLPPNIEPQRVRSVSPGAGIFLVAEYESSWAGFNALGRRGKPSEQVAAEGVEELLNFHQSEATLDKHLADQLILPIALSGQSATLPVEAVSDHALTNIWTVEQFLGPVAEVDHDHKLIQFKQRH